MEDILNLLKGKFDEKTLARIADELGENLNQIRPAIDAIIKKVTAGLGDQFANGDLLGNVKGFLDQDGDGDVDIHDITKAVQGGGLDLQKIISQIFGGNKEAFAASISQENGISQNSANSLIEKITAMAMDAVRKIKQEKGFDIEGLIALVTGGNSGNASGGTSLIAKVLNFIKSLLGSSSK